MNPKLKADNQGFLLGSPVDISRAVAQLKRIRNDIHDIKNALFGTSSTTKAANKTVESQSPPVLSAQGNENRQSKPVATPTRSKRDNAPVLLNTVSKAVTPTVSVKPSVTIVPNTLATANAVASVNKVTTPKAVTPTKRDSSGRFTSNDRDSEGRKDRGVISNLASRLTNVATVANVPTGLEEADPSIKAFNEVASPMMRGYESLVGAGGDKKGLKRIFKELNLFRKSETVFNKAQNKLLKNIEAKPSGGGDGGSGFFGAGITLGVSKMLSRKIPILGALLGGIGAYSAISNNEADSSLTRREKDKRNGNAVGGIAGSVGGMLAGAKLGGMAGAFLSPVGAVIGSVIGGAAGLFFGDQAGQIVGEKTGEWTSDLREADIPGKIIGAWTEATDSIKKGWDEALTLMADSWGKAKEVVTSAIEKSPKTRAAIEKFINSSPRTTAAVKGGIEWIGDHTTIGKGAKAISGKAANAWNDAKQYLTGASDKAGVDPGVVAKVANFESGFNSEATPTRKDGSKISSAHGFGQFLNSTWTDMVNKHGAKYGVEGAGKLTKEQAKKYRSDKTIQAGMLAEFTKENVEKGRKLGGSNDDANVYALHNLGEGTGSEFLKALKNNPSAPVNSVKGMSDKVISGNRSLYGNGKITIQEAYEKMSGAMTRGEAYANDARKPLVANAIPALQNLAAGVNSKTNNFSVSSPKIPTFTTVNPAEAPQVVQPLSSNSGREPQAQAPSYDVGQNLSSRGIAHIVSGGLSGTG